MNNNAHIVNFDPLCKKEIACAKEIYQKAKLEGREVLSPDRKRVINAWPAVRDGFIVAETKCLEGQFAVRILDETGDRRLIWDTNSPKETNEAMVKFLEYLGKGWRAYAIGRDGKKMHRIVSFNPDLEEVVFEEKGMREKLGSFTKKVSEVRMVPKTTPG